LLSRIQALAESSVVLENVIQHVRNLPALLNEVCNNSSNVKTVETQTGKQSPNAEWVSPNSAAQMKWTPKDEAAPENKEPVRYFLKRRIYLKMGFYNSSTILVS